MGWPVMIFAAGFGTRMRPLTLERPKPLIEVAGRPLIDRALDMAQDLPAERIVVNLHYKSDMLAAHLEGSDAQTVTEAPRILDTGGGLKNALPMLGNSTVMTLNPDAIWHGPNPLRQLAAAWNPAEMDGLLMCVPVAQTRGYHGPGDFSLDARGRIVRGAGVVYGGCQIIKTERLSEIPQEAFSLNCLWDLMVAENRLCALSYSGLWCDVGHPPGIAEAESMLNAPHV